MTKILLVEDNELNRDMLSRRLERKGFEVIVAWDGQQGVEKARADAPDLILMDMSLPVLAGWDATRILKKDNSTHGIPVIALTANAMLGDRDRALECGCDDYDTKPVDLDRLLTKIESVLRSSSRTGEVKVVSEPENFVSFDPMVLRSLRDNEFGGDAKPIAILVETFLRNTAQLFNDFGRFLQLGDLPQLQRISHMLTASCRTVGANTLGLLFAQTEQFAKDEELEEIRKLDRQLNDEMARAITALSEFR